VNNKKDTHNSIFIAVTACFILSGFAALLYQTAWMRQFSVIFGTSELAVATILSAYMAGLALGAAVAGRFVNRVVRPVLVYGVLEAAIAISALCVPWLMAGADLLYIELFGNQPEPADASGLGQSFFYLVVAFIVLAIPTSCMGATLPLLTKHVVFSDEQIGPRVGGLYAMNTVGAIGGTLAAGFFFLPWLGLSGTVWVGVSVNLLVFVIAAGIAKKIAVAGPEKHPPSLQTGTRPAKTSFGLFGTFWILPLMLLSGANTFTYEVLWTRLLGHILGGSVAAFSTMLASFLSGIAIGSALAARFAKKREAATAGFVLAQCGIAITSILIYKYFSLLIPDIPGLSNNVLVAIGILMPATLFIGATFPFAVRILAENQATAAHASARVYAWNTFGAIVGAAIAGFFLIPLLKYEGAIRFAVLGNAAIAFVAGSLFYQKRRYITGIAGAILAVILITYKPALPEEILRVSPIVQRSRGEIIFYDVGRSATVVVLEEDGFLNLRTNGLPEAATNLKGAPPSQHSQHLLSSVPILARPDTSEMLIIGFGAGVAVEGIAGSVDSIDVIELEPKVIEANRAIGASRAVDPLADPRVNIIINDARSALSLTSKKYDAIVSQPSHPWTAGASHLYTREFMNIAKEHLNPDGVFLQWMNSQFLSESLLKSLCATMLDVYRYVRIYQWDNEVLFFLGSQEPLNPERSLGMTGRPFSDEPVHYLEIGIGSVEDLLVALNMDQENIELFSRGAPVLTDNMNRMATESAMTMDRGEALTFRDLERLFLPYDPLLQSDSFIHQNFPVDIEFSYIAEQLERNGFKQRAVDLATMLGNTNPAESLLLVGMGLERQGQRPESQRLLLSSLLSDPTNDQARFAILKPWLNQLEDEGTPEYIDEIAGQLTGPGAAVFEGWKAAAEEDWQRLVELDGELAESLPTDQWYLESVKLRADWRTKVVSPGFQPGLAREAKRLIDNAIAIFHDPDLYSLRIASAFVADDAPDIVETARRLIYLFDDEIRMANDGLIEISSESLDRKLLQINTIRQVVGQTRLNHDIEDYKTNALDEKLENTIQKLQALGKDDSSAL